MRAVRLWATITAAPSRCLPPSSWRSRSRPHRPPRTRSGRTTAPGLCLPRCRARRPTPPAPPATPGFKSYPGMNCWSCHAPGPGHVHALLTEFRLQPGMPPLGPVAEAVQHRRSPTARTRISGPPSACLDCHPTSVSISDPGSSPHHRARRRVHPVRRLPLVAAEARRQGRLHAVPHQRAAFHLYKANSPGFKKCGSCHAMKHAGVKIATSKCAACHKGSGGRPVAALHHRSPRSTCCGGCHSKKLHASAVSQVGQELPHVPQRQVPRAARSCRPGRCARAATRRPLRHANGFQCTLCHRRAIHKPRPSAIN